MTARGDMHRRPGAERVPDLPAWPHPLRTYLQRPCKRTNLGKHDHRRGGRPIGPAARSRVTSPDRRCREIPSPVAGPIWPLDAGGRGTQRKVTATLENFGQTPANARSPPAQQSRKLGLPGNRIDNRLHNSWNSRCLRPVVWAGSWLPRTQKSAARFGSLDPRPASPGIVHAACTSLSNTKAR
jgi:hypothetical protein